MQTIANESMVGYKFISKTATIHFLLFRKDFFTNPVQFSFHFPFRRLQNVGTNILSLLDFVNKAILFNQQATRPAEVSIGRFPIEKFHPQHEHVED